MRLCFVFLACLLSGLTTAAGQAKHPSIAFEFQSKDFGSISQGQRIKETFLFANKGTAVLKITDIEKS
jgi:hypothetical protein